MLNRARKQKHTVEGLLLALADIDKIIKVIRQSKTQAEAKQGLMGIECPASMLEKALGEEGFGLFKEERGESDVYHLTPVQADAILRMTLGQLVNLEQDRLSGQHQKFLDEIKEYQRILSDEQIIRDMIKEDLEEIKRKYANARRTVISNEELTEIFDEDLIEEENMVVSISTRGYIKRTPVSTYRAQKRGGKGIKGAKSEDEDPIEHVFAASTHDYLLFFSNRGRVYWRKVYQLPQLSRESRGRAIVNLLTLEEGEKIADCRAIRDFTAPDHYLMMATKSGLVKKTLLSAYGRPRKGGIIAIKLREDDELIDIAVAKKGDDIVLSTANGMAIRFDESDARPMGRNTSGVKGVTLKDDTLVGMVVADPDATLLTVCEFGYGKRTYFGPKVVEDDDETSSSMRYRGQKRGGKGVRDIKTTARNGKVVDILPVNDEDEILLMTSRGKLQRIACSDIKPIGRNTQGVRIMALDEGDSLAAVVKVPPEDDDGSDAQQSPAEPDSPATESKPADAGASTDASAEASEESGENQGEES